MQTALITGASSGIGEATAYVYAKNNYNLIITARRKDKLDDIKKDIEETYDVNVTVFDVDLAQLTGADVLYKHVSDNNITINVLINNAGFGIDAYFKDTNIKHQTDMLTLNMINLTKLTKLFLTDMLKNGSGHIINISSGAAFQPIPKYATYAASKAYVLHFSEALASELKSENIKVTTICPGATQSEFADTANVKNRASFDNGPTSAELGEFVFKSMKQGKVVAIHGFKNRFFAFMVRFLPRNFITAITAKFM